MRSPLFVCRPSAHLHHTRTFCATRRTRSRRSPRASERPLWRDRAELCLSQRGRRTETNAARSAGHEGNLALDVKDIARPKELGARTASRHLVSASTAHASRDLVLGQRRWRRRRRCACAAALRILTCLLSLWPLDRTRRRRTFRCGPNDLFLGFKAHCSAAQCVACELHFDVRHSIRIGDELICATCASEVDQVPSSSGGRTSLRFGDQIFSVECDF